MRDDQSFETIKRVLAGDAPAAPEESTLANVRAAARVAAATGRKRTAGWEVARRPAWQVWTTAAVVSVALVAGALGVSLRGPRLTMAFAKEDALAALVPKPGYVLHLKTTEWAKNADDPNPMPWSNEYSETWTDFAGQRGHAYWRLKSDDTLRGEAVVVNSRSRFMWTNDEFDPPRKQVTDGKMDEGLIGSELGPYRYLREHLPEGEVVGEVVVKGERYWDIRWDGVKDSGGLKINARALLRQPDYRPLRIETEYPGSSKGIWTVLDWEVVPLAEVDESMFDPASIPYNRYFEERAYLLSEIGIFNEFPAWWLGKKSGARMAERQERLIDKGDHTETVLGEPVFYYYYPGSDATDDEFGGAGRLSMKYRGAKLDTVTVTSMAALPPGQAPSWLRPGAASDEITRIETEAGTALVASGTEMTRGYISRADGLVVIESRDASAVKAAFSAVRRAQ